MFSMSYLHSYFYVPFPFCLILTYSIFILFAKSLEYISCILIAIRNQVNIINTIFNFRPNFYPKSRVILLSYFNHMISSSYTPTILLVCIQLIKSNHTTFSATNTNTFAAQISPNSFHTRRINLLVFFYWKCLGKQSPFLSISIELVCHSRESTNSSRDPSLAASRAFLFRREFSNRRNSQPRWLQTVIPNRRAREAHRTHLNITRRCSGTEARKWTFIFIQSFDNVFLSDNRRFNCQLSGCRDT